MATFECPRCGEIQEDAKIYECPECGDELLDCCIAGNNVKCFDCEEEESGWQEEDECC